MKWMKNIYKLGKKIRKYLYGVLSINDYIMYFKIDEK